MNLKHLLLALMVSVSVAGPAAATVDPACDEGVANQLKQAGDENAELLRGYIEQAIAELDPRNMSCLWDLLNMRGGLNFSFPTFADLLNAARTMVCNIAEEAMSQVTTSIYQSISIPGATLPGGAYIPGVSVSGSYGPGTGSTGAQRWEGGGNVSWSNAGQINGIRDQVRAEQGQGGQQNDGSLDRVKNLWRSIWD